MLGITLGLRLLFSLIIWLIQCRRHKYGYNYGGLNKITLPPVFVPICTLSAGRDGVKASVNYVLSNHSCNQSYLFKIILGKMVRLLYVIGCQCGTSLSKNEMSLSPLYHCGILLRSYLLERGKCFHFILFLFDLPYIIG